MRDIEKRDNQLLWGNHFVTDLAKKYGTPLYVYDESVLLAAINDIRDDMWSVHYALKANPSPQALKTMLDQGIGIDAVSANEVNYAVRMGFKQENIVYTSSAICKEEIKEILKTGVLINLNSVEEVDLYGQIAPNTRIGIRINPEVVAGHHQHVQTASEISKFGILADQVATALETARKYNLKVVMAHFHIGSGILEAESFIEAFRNLLTIFDQNEFPDLEFINLGGGFSTPYHPTDPRLDMGYLKREIKKLHQGFNKKASKQTKLIIEPGRFLINECGILVVNINTISRNHVRTFYRVNSGFNNLARPAMYGSYHHFINASAVEGETEPVILAGNICESGDVFNETKRELTKAKVNDKIAIMDTGAYGISMAMGTYNLRGLPAEIYITKEGKIIESAKRQTLEDILDRYLD